MIYRGVCVGGPIDGAMRVERDPAFRVQESEKLSSVEYWDKAKAGVAPKEVKIHTYLWIDWAAHGVWRHESMTTEQVAEHLIHAYAETRGK